MFVNTHVFFSSLLQPSQNQNKICKTQLLYIECSPNTLAGDIDLCWSIRFFFFKYLPFSNFPCIFEVVHLKRLLWLDLFLEINHLIFKERKEKKTGQSFREMNKSKKSIILFFYIYNITFLTKIYFLKFKLEWHIKITIIFELFINIFVLFSSNSRTEFN